MRPVSAILLALAAAAAPNIVNADFTVSAATTTQSGSTYVRQWTLTASGSNSRYIDQIKIEAPGQVFISYLSGQASGVAGYVNVTSSSSTAVDAMAVRTGADTDSDDDESGGDDSDDAELRIKFDSTATASDTLITEIFLAQESTISELQTKSSADVIVQSGVIVASGTNADLSIDVEGSGSVYVSDASAAISIKEFQAKVSGSGSLQVVVGSVALTEDAEFESQGSGGISLFASSLSANELNFDVTGSGSICIAAETITATTSEVDGAASQVSLPNSSNKYSTTGSSACTEATVPSRTSTATSSATSGSSASTSSGSVVGTTTTPSTTPTPTPTPTPTSGSSSLSIAAVGQLVVLALAASL